MEDEYGPQSMERFGAPKCFIVPRQVTSAQMFTWPEEVPSINRKKFDLLIGCGGSEVRLSFGAKEEELAEECFAWFRKCIIACRS